LQNASLVFKNMGAHVEKVDLSWIADLAVSNSRITQADAAAYHHQRLIEHPDWFGADVLQRLQAGAALSSSEYALARRMQSESHRSFENFFGKYDLLILPTTPISAPPIEGTAAIEAARQLTRFTSPFNLTGLPALTVPCGFSDGLPFGLQMVSQPWSEARLLQAGSAFEKADPWHENQFRLRVQ
jgi:aspartyl-tRNA(Asn)/glutamyl-tRNA(Gln) amidotransferase subunit A